MKNRQVRLAIVGGGPAGLMLFDKVVASAPRDLKVDIFESSAVLGSGMPYSTEGALKEHVTNVSADELPELSEMLDTWVLQQPDQTLQEFGIDRDSFHEKKVVPRLLFGRYLRAQFESLIAQAKKIGMAVDVHLECKIANIVDHPEKDCVSVKVCGEHAGNGSSVVSTNDGLEFDRVVLATGHQWEKHLENKVPGYFDSPYPPAKIAQKFNHTVVIRGSSLTAIDAIKTVAKNNGKFFWKGDRYCFELNSDSPDFKIEMHSRDGLLPSVRVHMEEPHVDSKSLIPQEKLDENMRANDGFLQLDFLFEQGFKLPLAESDPKFFEQIKDLTIEQFVDKMMSYRENKSAFDLLKQEYSQSLQSIEQEKPVPWKEMLASLSFAMNYPAKHLSAEDMLRLRGKLMPLISVVIAFMPQGSGETLLALHEAGLLELIADGEGGDVKVDDEGRIIYSLLGQDGKRTETVCQTFIDCIGQRPLNIDQFPFQGLVEQGTVCSARLQFRSSGAAQKLLESGEKSVEEIERDDDKADRTGKDDKDGSEDSPYFLRLSGAAIDDNFEVIDKSGKPNKRIYLMAVPHMSGFNPDYSGLDFCEQASKRIVSDIFKLDEQS